MHERDRRLFERATALEHVEKDSIQLQSVFPALSRSRYVGGEGPDENVQAFIVGEAPSAIESINRRPFVGRSGMVLRQLIRLGGLEPSQCWLTNLLKFKTPGNRHPTVTEIKAFRLPLQAEWVAVGAPKLIITVGSAAWQAIVGVGQHAEGPVQVVNGTIVYPMHHPRVAFGNTEAQEQIEKEWETLKNWTENASP